MLETKTAKRIVRGAVFGIACYELDEKQSNETELTYIHKGVVETKVDADRWLRGQQPRELIKVYPIED
jgi:hypothetical protein